MAETRLPVVWSIFSTHGSVLLCIAGDPTVRLRQIADRVGISERHAYTIVRDLTKDGVVGKMKVGRRNIYSIERDREMTRPAVSHCTIDSMLTALDM